MLQVQAGELRSQSLTGPVEIESNGTRITLDDLTGTRRSIRVNAVGGSVTMSGLRSDTRIDGRDTRIDVTIDQPAPVAIYNEAEEPIDVTLPAGGFQLDALTTDGRLSVPEGLVEVKTAENEQRASAAIGGGGPTLMLRAKRGNITIKAKRRSIAQPSAFSFQLSLIRLQLQLRLRTSSRFQFELQPSPQLPSTFRLQTSDFLL